MEDTERKWAEKEGNICIKGKRGEREGDRDREGGRGREVNEEGRGGKEKQSERR